VDHNKIIFDKINVDLLEKEVSLNNILMKRKHALITGGSKGLGRAIAIKFAENNIDVGIIGRDENGLKETCSLVEKIGGKCLIIKADLSKIDELSRAADEALTYNLNWDILVNNAGFAKQVSLLDTELEDWELIHNINLRAVFLLSQKIVPQMIEQKHGKVINISSLGAFFGTRGMGAYGSSKAALNQLTRTMAVEWGPHNIQVNAICPTIVMTEMGKNIWDDPKNKAIADAFLNKIPVGRFGQPEDVANLAYFLATEQSDYLNGVAIPLDGGKTVQP
jgi:NAD(P)-dependent dehydrogenase (short-subunit alcohol dehydrogenase family)